MLLSPMALTGLPSYAPASGRAPVSYTHLVSGTGQPLLPLDVLTLPWEVVDILFAGEGFVASPVIVRLIKPAGTD